MDERLTTRGHLNLKARACAHGAWKPCPPKHCRCSPQPSWHPVSVWSCCQTLKPWDYGQSWSDSVPIGASLQARSGNLQFSSFRKQFMILCSDAYMRPSTCQLLEFVKRKKLVKKCLYSHMTLTWVQEITNFPERRDCFPLSTSASAYEARVASDSTRFWATSQRPGCHSTTRGDDSSFLFSPLAASHPNLCKGSRLCP